MARPTQNHFTRSSTGASSASCSGSRRSRRSAAFELAYTCVDVAAGLSFLAGSIMFFYDWLRVPATWCFVIGSVMFSTKPVLRIVGDMRLLAHGEVDELARRQES